MKTQKKDGCPTLNLIHVVGKRWTIPIIEEAYFSEGSVSFNELQRSLYGITPRMLSNSLDELQEYSLLERRENNSGNATHTQYSLTDKGHEVANLIREIKELGRCFYTYDTNAACKNMKCSACGLLDR